MATTDIKELLVTTTSVHLKERYVHRQQSTTYTLAYMLFLNNFSTLMVLRDIQDTLVLK